MKPVEALPKEGIEYLIDNTPGYSVEVGYHEKNGWVEVKCPGRSFSCLVSHLPYILLCDNKKIDELREEIEYLEKRITMMYGVLGFERTD